MLLNNKYILLENIACGQFGKIVKVKYNTNYYAIKLGSKDVIKYEALIYKKLKDYLLTGSLIHIKVHSVVQEKKSLFFELSAQTLLFLACFKDKFNLILEY